jgi:hypothetical protein
MEKKNNFISIITLGNFNPAILTPKFLSEKCGFKNENKLKEETSPVVSSIDFDKISFLMDLERFQIVEKEISNFNETISIKLMNKYLDTLSFTPVYVMGLNLNIDVKTTPKKPVKNLNDKAYILKVLGAKELIYNSIIKYSENSVDYISWDIIKQNQAISRITVKKKEDNIFTINYNIEIRNIEKSRDNILFFEKDLNNINLKCQNFLESVF